MKHSNNILCSGMFNDVIVFNVVSSYWRLIH